MPTFAAGHDAALSDATPGPQSGQQDPRTSPQSRRQANPPVAGLARSSRSCRPHNARQPTRSRQIPIDRASPNAEPKPPAVSSPEACPTPAGRGHATHPTVSGRCPTTLNTTGHSLLLKSNRNVAHCDAGGGSRPPHHKRTLLYSDYLPITGRMIRPSARRMMAPEPLPSSSCRGHGCPGRFAWRACCAAWRSWAPPWDSPAATPTALDIVAGSCGRRS